MSDLRRAIYDQVHAVAPFDDAEAADRNEMLAWLEGDEPIFRITKPAHPRKHLVSYLALYDPAKRSVLLVEHKRAKIWLPNGGHVEIDEDPRDTALRECQEELGVVADFWRGRAEPFFVTATQTINEPPETTHTDMSLWYILQGGTDMSLHWDGSEFSAVKWVGLQEIAEDKSYFEPLRRFCRKLASDII